MIGARGETRMRRDAGGWISVAMVVTCALVTSVVPAGAATPPKPSAEVQTATETFWRPAMSFLKSAHGQSSAVAKALANLNDGITTVNDIKAMILKARFVENTAFQGEFRAKAKGDPPLDLMPLMTATEDVHERFQTSTATILDGWKGEADSKVLENGIAAFKEMVIQLNAAVDTGNAWAKEHAASAK